MAENTEKLKKAFIDTVGVPKDADWQGVVYGSTATWDSVAHMALISEIENSFDIMLGTDEVINLSDFNKAKEILGGHGIAFDAK